MTSEFQAHVCENGHVTYPEHDLCPECGAKQVEEIDLSDRKGEVVTWTENTATPPGVREPNLLAIVEFDLHEVDTEDDHVRAIGQVTPSSEIEIGDEVKPVYVDELREPGAGIREPESQEWDGYRFEPV